MADKYAPVRKYSKFTEKINEQREKGEDYSKQYAAREKVKPKVQEILTEDVTAAASELLGKKLSADFLLVDETKRPERLVISRRDRLELVKIMNLGFNASEKKKRALEKKFNDSGYSTYIYTSEAVSTKPILLNENTARDGIIQILAHETAHHYFFGKPLGKNVESNECRAINETSATILGKEIGEYCISKSSGQSGIPFYAEPDYLEREGKIIRHVEKLLSEGKLEQAETYMKKGNRNQAMLAFWKMYGSDKENGMTRTLNALKSECYDLKDFAETVAQTMNYKQVEGALQQKRGDNEYYAFRALGGYSNWNVRGRSGGR